MVSLTMLPGTALAFHRKRQTVASLANERPQSLESFYDVITEAIEEVESRLQLVEKSFYGEHLTPEREIKQWMHAINSVLKATRVPMIQSLTQLEQIQFQVKELSQAKAVDECLMDQVYQSVRKTLNSVRDDFEPLIEEVQRMADFVGKYCLSFAEESSDPYMETATAYARQTNDFKDTIGKNLENIMSMALMFQKDGLLFNQFRNSDVAQIAYKAECPHAAYLLLFPEACENIREALKALIKWVGEDKTYASFVRVDMADLEKTKVGRAKHLREVQQRSFQLEFKVKACKKLVTDMYEEFEKLKDKESHFVEEEKVLMDEHREIVLDLELKALRKDNLKRESTRLSSREFNEKNERLIFETSALKERQQILTRRLEEMRTKTKWLTGKRELRKGKEAELSTLKRELKTIRKEVRSAEVELNRVDSCLSKLKKIYIYKTSPDVLKKIFHNIPLDTKKTAAGTRPKSKDDLARAARAVAKNIDRDWMRLYSSLPFVPSRGDETVKRDIAELSYEHLRENEEAQAKHILAKWRRVHTQATVDDLKSTLTKMKRQDVVKRIKSALAPKPTIRVKSNRHVRFPAMAPREKKLYKFNF